MSTRMRGRRALTAGQRELWLSQQLKPGSTDFHVAEYLLIDGPLDTAAFEAALRRAVAEAEPYNVRFGSDDGVPWQAYQPVTDWELPVVDVSAEADPRAAAEERMRHLLARPMDLTRPPLFAYALFRLGPERFAWFECIHHLIGDAAAAALVARRVAELYTASTERQPTPDTAAAVPHTAGPDPHALLPGPRTTSPLGPLAALVESDAVYRSSDDFAADEAYWTERFAEHPEPARLHDGTAAPSSAVLRRTVHLSQEDTARLRAAARAARTHWSALVVAATAGYLHRMTGRHDIVLTLPVSGRTDAVQRGVPGMFANLVPLLLHVTADTPVRDLVRQTSREMRQALRHQRYRRTDFAHALGLPHGGMRHLGPHVNIMDLDYSLTFRGHRASAHNISNGLVDDLAVMVYDRSDGEGLRIDVNANSGLYTPESLAAHTARFLRLLRGFGDPAAVARTVAEAAPTPAAVRRRMLQHSTGAVRPVPAATVTGMLTAQAERTPARTALIDGDRSFTYRELHQAADRLARSLARRGAGPGRTVAVALPRGADLVIALVAVLATGAAYVPLDVEYPRERLALLLDDVRPALLVTRSDTAPVLPGDTPARVLLDTAEAAEAAGRGADGAAVTGPRPDDPAYVIHTSGSTGTPKGVVVPHRAVTHLLRWMQHTFALYDGDRLLLKTPVSFDASVPELFWPLVSGATLVPAPPGGHRDPRELARTVCQQGVSTAQFVPTALDAFLDVLDTDRELAAGCARTLRQVFCGGEALGRPTVNRFHRLLPGVALHNVYGPTEATVNVSHQPCAAGGTGAVPLGRPAWNSGLYVLDEQLGLCPPDVPGELYIGGPQVAQEYLNRPELTAERFRPDPFGPPGARLYRTGDLARRTEDGTLHYLGRADDQVKVNGFRIELGEVDAALRALPGIRQAAAAVRTTAAGDRQLVAYVTAGPGAAQDATAIRQRLARTLPAHLVPATVTFLPELPHTSNGKLDRAALPALATRPPEHRSRPPRTSRERRLSVLFAQVLDVDEIGVDDDFFDLGGTSLQASRLAGRVRAALGLPLSLNDLFTAPTVARLATHLDTAAAPAVPSGTNGLEPLLTLRAHGAAPPLFCFHPGGGVSWGYSGLLRYLGDRPVHALQARALTPPHLLPRSLDEMADDYTTVLRTVRPHGPYHLLGWSFGGLLAHAVATRLQHAGQEVASLIVLDAYPAVPGTPADWARLATADWPRLIIEVLGAQELSGAARTPGSDRQLLTEVARLTGLPAYLLEGEDSFLFQDIVRNDHRLRDAHVPAVYRGDMLLFTADEPVPGLPTPAPDPNRWRPHVDGRLTVHKIPAQHYHLLRPEHLAVIGPAVAAALDGASRLFPSGPVPVNR
jgi:enterobactin synthetase component F